MIKKAGRVLINRQLIIYGFLKKLINKENDMRKIFFYAFILFSITGACELYANIDNLSNMSAEWIRTGNRNAATDAADIVVYNPGAVTELPDGFQIDAGNQTLMRKPEHSYDMGAGKESHEQDGIDWFLPSIYLTFNKDDWALFGGYYISGGGAVADYPDGSVTTDLIGANVVFNYGGTYSDEYLKAESIYNTFTFGGAYKINDIISGALGMRYLSVKNSMKGGITSSMAGEIKVDAKEDADGFGLVAGLNINPTKEMNIGIQYQSQVNLEFETSVNRDDVGLYTDGAKNRRDLPAVLGLGIGYDINDKLYVEADYSYWFQENCDWEKDGNGKDIAKMAGDAQSAGITTSYRFLPELLASVGATYTDFKWNDKNGYYEANTGSYEVLYSDNWHLGCGVAYTVIENVVLNLSLARTIWEDETLTNSQVPGGLTIKTQNSTTIVAVGIKASF